MNSNEFLRKTDLTPCGLFVAMDEIEAMRSCSRADLFETVGNFNYDNTLLFHVLIEPLGENDFTLDIKGVDAQRALTRKETAAIIDAFKPLFEDEIVKTALLVRVEMYYIYAPATPHNTIVKNEK